VRGAASLIVLTLAGAPALAQEEEFSRQMDDALAPAGETAPFVNCTGFFQAFRMLAGPDTEPGAAAFERELDLAVMSTILRQQETGADEGAVMDEIRPLIEAAAELYIARIVDNDAATGNVMDDGLTETLAVCSGLRQQFLDATGGLGD